jgi:hypothetical protein
MDRQLAVAPMTIFNVCFKIKRKPSPLVLDINLKDNTVAGGGLVAT